MVRTVLEFKSEEVYGVWTSHTTFPPHVYFTYNYQRVVPTVTEPSSELHDLLHELSSAMGVWEQEGDEDV